MSTKNNSLQQWSYRLLPIGIFLLGTLLRIVYLGAIPGGIHQDEAFVALNSFGLFHEGMDSAGNRLPVYMSSWGDGQSAMYSWLLTPLLALNRGIPTLLLTRIPQVVVSLLTLWCVYCLMKRCFGRTPALWALFALAICPWHVMMSRWGLDANMAPGFLMFALYFFIRGLENKRLLPLAGLFYGLCLYCYAVIWPIIPVILLFQILYGLYHKKLTINRYSITAAVMVFILALPLMLFLLVNQGILAEIRLPFMTIPKTLGYRGAEVATGFTQIIANIKNAARLFIFQDTGSPWDVIQPWGLFYDVGRVFIVIGAFILLIKLIKSFLHKEFAYEFFIFTQLLGGGIICLLVSVSIHQLNAMFIPLVLCEAYGIWQIGLFIKSRQKYLACAYHGIVTAICLLCLILFQKDYYTDYKNLVNAYFGIGIEECMDYALNQCEELEIDTITVEKGAQWPRLLLYTETLPSQYLSSVEYDVAPAPAAFTTADGIRINTRINYDNINTDSVYIIYFPDAQTFETDFELTSFHDWYVAVPKSNN